VQPDLSARRQRQRVDVFRAGLQRLQCTQQAKVFRQHRGARQESREPTQIRVKALKVLKVIVTQHE
jgi:hypothetical protein